LLGPLGGGGAGFWAARLQLACRMCTTAMCRAAKLPASPRMPLSCPLLPLPASLRSKWAAEQGYIPSSDAPVRFMFDGDQLSPSETPAGLDLEGEEIIEVHF